MRASTFFIAKNLEKKSSFIQIKFLMIIKFLIRVCAHGKGGVEAVQIFCGQGVNFFGILCGRLLWTSPNEKSFIG